MAVFEGMVTDPSGLDPEDPEPCNPGDICYIFPPSDGSRPFGRGGGGSEDTGIIIETGPEQDPGTGSTGQTPQSHDIAQIKDVTDCDRFAAEVARLALQNSTLGEFVQALVNRFAAEGDYLANTEFASGGFKQQFSDPDPTSANQARHYVGALRAQVAWGRLGRHLMNRRERSREGESAETARSHHADLALNAVAFDHGQKLQSGQAKMTDLQIMILRDVCR